MTLNLKNILQKKLYFLLLRRISEIAEKERFSIFLVGGIVRDLLLKRKNIDLDIAVEEDGIEFAKILKKKIKAKLKTYPKFGTSFLILPNRMRIDVATARKEKYRSPAVLPEVKFSNIKEDLFRRDFTINSLAINLNKNNFGELIDYFGGVSDLKRGIIRALHNLSFVDDPTRIFRAVRFEQRYNFVIEENTEDLIKKAVNDNLISLLSTERLKNELLYIFKEKNPEKSIIRMSELNILKGIHPKISLDKEGKLNLKKLKYLNLDKFEFDKPFIYFLLISQNMDKESKTELSLRLKLSKKEQKNFIFCDDYFNMLEDKLSVKEIKDSEIYILLKDFSNELLLYFLIRSKNKIVKSRIKYYIKKLSKINTSISGRDLLKLGYKEGPLISETLNEILYKKMDGLIKNKNEEIKYAKEKISCGK